MAANNPAFETEEDIQIDGGTNNDERTNKRVLDQQEEDFTEGKETNTEPSLTTIEFGAVDIKANGHAHTKKESSTSELMYTINDVPPWYMCILLGMQHYLTMVGATITIPFLLTPAMCIDDKDSVRGAFVSTIIFVSGIVTLLQTTFGIRLPIVQGGTFSFLVPTLVILGTSFEPCSQQSFSNITLTDMTEEQKVNYTENWQVRIREVQGAIIVSSLLQIIVGFTGIIGLVLRFITPLAIAPTVALVGLSLFDAAAQKASGHWGIAFMTIAIMIIFSQYLRDIPIPVPTYSKEKGLVFTPAYIFKLFPVLLSIIISWSFCAILTAADALPSESLARTDRVSSLIDDAPWLTFPYPGQWGLPTVTAAGVFGMMAGVIASMIESVGDYYACARLAGAPSPPTHAVNRGIGIEGIGCILAGLWGTGNGTTSYSENIGAIGVTKVGSLRVVQYGAVIMMIFGILGKVGALFVTVPDPVVGGIFCVMFAMITAVGLSSLQFVDLNSSRNLFILGFSLFFGLALPKWLGATPGAIQTGSEIFDQILTVLLSTSMFVGGFLGFFLDNTIPGTPEERGLTKWNSHLEAKDSEEGSKVLHTSEKCYDIPIFMEKINNWKLSRYIPICPTFEGYSRKRT